MAFILARPPSPPHSEVDSLSAALHAALQPFSSGPSSSHLPSQPPPDTDMHRDRDKEKHHPSLDIVLASDVLCLKGTGVDVNPALLSGNVVLHLSEPTSIKEISLQFRGKARVPASANESLTLNSSPLIYLVCSHEWSFLEGTKSHGHTLKAGRHLFPFQLHIGGSLPSSIQTTSLGGASVQYKLRATAVRPGFSIAHRDLQALQPVTIIRSFGAEALEYQQTLEIENTWPEKLMYSIMLPHKAWAAGEDVTAVVKFSPLVKGARVLNVTTTVNETVKIYGRLGCQEHTRPIASTKHDIVHGKAVLADLQQPRHHRTAFGHHAVGDGSRTVSLQTSPGVGHPHHSQYANGTQGGYFPPAAPHSDSPSHSPAEMAPLTTTTTNSSSSSGPASRATGPSSISVNTAPVSGQYWSPQPSTSTEPSSSDPPFAVDEDQSSDVVTTLRIALPPNATPTHALEPIQVTHRIRWSILISNLDGHTSELRCSLPLHVLDYRLYDEARAATLATRRLLLGADEIDGGSAVYANGDAEDEDMELPSYPAHVRDRVANAFLPDSAVMRVVNPWVVQGVSPTFQTRSEGSSGLQSPAALETYAVGTASPAAHPRNHLPPIPAPGAQPLEWVNSELLLSQSQEAPEAPQAPPPPRPLSRVTPPESAGGSRHTSRFPSRRNSRANSRAGSRAASPERDAASPAGSSETYVHSSSTASRNLHGLFNITMKPFTSLTSSFSLRHGHAAPAVLPPGAHTRSGSGTATPALSTSASTTNLLDLHSRDPVTGAGLLHRAFTEVPDYDVASRGFLGGGVPPLSSMNGLPSYEEAAERGLAERSLSEADLAGMFAMTQAQPYPRSRLASARTLPASPQ